MKSILIVAGFSLLSGIAAAQVAAPVAPSGKIVPGDGISVVRQSEAEVANSDIVARQAASTFQTIDLSQFNISAPAVAPYAGIQTGRNGANIVLKPNADTPANSFGWIEAPTISVSGGGGSTGDSVVVRVRYTRSATFNGTAPTLRVRLHNGDFSLYTTGGNSPNAVISDGNTGELTLSFDRNKLASGSNTFRIFVDLMSIYEAGTVVDPNFEFQITEVAYAILNADDNQPTTVFTAVYREDDGDLHAHVNGSTSRVRLRSTIDRYAWDGEWCVVLDGDNLYAYRASNPTSEITIETSRDVFNAAIAGNHVVFHAEDGEAYVQNLITGNRRRIVNSGADGVGSAGDGRTALVLDVATFSGADLYAFDTEASNPNLVELVTDNDVDDLRGRMSIHY